jgi:hypothetical protein
MSPSSCEPTQLDPIARANLMSPDTSDNTSSAYKVNTTQTTDERQTSPVYRARLNRFHRKTEAESSLRNVLF